MVEFKDRIAGLSPKRLALLAVELQRRLEQAESRVHEPIAIVGIGCRFPGYVRGSDAYWQMLKDGTDCVGEVPADRWDADEFYDPDPKAPGKMVTQCGGFIDDIDLFDAAFFGITPREATSLDPRYRILLEVVWEALEHAGQSPDSLFGSRSGVFVGACGSDYYQLLVEGRPNTLDAYLVSGVATSMASGRISYALGLHGPALSVDTACSSSLVAVHLACQSLRSNECDLAIASGTTLILAPEISIGLSSAEMLSPDGRCKTFDTAANGIVRGEGCGAVVLKRLSVAESDGDRVLAVIRGTAVNQDGRSGGITAPNGPAQEAVIREALLRSGVDPAEIGYVESHGTGTMLGDPIEIRALDAVYGNDRPRSKPLRVGSVKTNFGHLEASAGIAGLIKAVLALDKENIPPHLHLQKPSPHIEWHEMCVTIPVELTPWKRGQERRLAGVSSFGFSGTNAHVIVEEAPPPKAPDVHDDTPAFMLSLSAKTSSALNELLSSYVDNLSHYAARPIADVCFTANVGRAQFEERVAIVGNSHDDIVQGLAALRENEPCSHAFRGHAESSQAADVVFLFSGNGYPDAKTGRQLCESAPSVRRTIERCAAILQPLLGDPIRAMLCPEKGVAATPVDDARCRQAATFVWQYALAELWRSWGVVPAIAVGYDVGEFAAACVAGVFTLEDALELVVRRAELATSQSDERVLCAVFADAPRVAEQISARDWSIQISAVNGPAHTVVSGATIDVNALCTAFARLNIKTQVLSAAPTSLSGAALDEFEREIAARPRGQAAFGLISCTSGQLAEPAEIASSGYWRRQCSETVDFFAAMQGMPAAGYRLFLEISPNPQLLPLARCIVQAEDAAWLPSLQSGRDDWAQLLHSLAALYVRGVNVNLQAIDARPSRQIVSLPTYPFEHKRYWPERVPGRFAAGARPAREKWRDWLYELKWRLRVTRRAANLPADFLSSPKAIAACARQHIEPLSVQNSLDISTELLPKLNALTTQYILHALHKLGWEPAFESRFTRKSLCEQLGIIPQHNRLVLRMLDILAEDNILASDGEEWAVIEVPEMLDPGPVAARLLERYPECSAELTITRNCARSLAEVLRGQVDPMQLLFPGGSLSLTEDLYQRAPALRIQNALLEKALSAAIDQLPDGQKVRILEIGAGTGSASSYLLSSLPKERTEYVFTDVSNAFLSAAERKFSDYPFVSYRLLDISEDPAAQGYAAREFDIVIAANVLHATADIRRTLTNVSSLLAPEGVVMLIEGVQPQRFGDLTVGLTPGWWSFADTDLRSYALLASDDWKRLFKEIGFTQVADVLGDGGTDNPVLTQAAILVARGPGVEKTSASTRERCGDWLVLCDENGAGHRIASIIEERGGRCFTATKATDFSANGDGQFTFNPARAEDYDRLLAATRDVGATSLHGVLYLLALDEDLAANSDTSVLRKIQARVCGSALHLIKAVAQHDDKPPRIVMVTEGAQLVGSIPDQLNIAQSTLWGLGRVLGLEHPELRHALIDLERGLPESSLQSLVNVLVDENTEADQIALRQHHRYELRIAKSDVADRPSVETPVVEPNATYLVTGGLAGLGLLTAQWLVDRGARQLILVARSGPTDAAQKTIAAMEKSGVRVFTVQADVSSHEQLEAGLLPIDFSGKPLRGIVHSAGVLDDGVLLQQDWSRFQRVMRSKVDGSWNLHQLSLNHSLDFFVLFSSGASFIGSPGQSNHAAANAFMDSLAHLRRALGLSGLSINWGPWSEIGAAVRTGVVSRADTKGLNTIAPAQGLKILEHLIAGSPAQVGVLPLNPSELASNRPRAGRANLYAEMDELATKAIGMGSMPSDIAPTAPQLLPLLASASPGRRAVIVLEQLQKQAAKTMGLDADETIDPGRPLTDLGLDSLMAVELRNEIAKQIGKSLPATLLFNHPTLDELTAYLLDEVLITELKAGRNVEARMNIGGETASVAAAESELDQLSEDEMADLLAAALEDPDDFE